MRVRNLSDRDVLEIDPPNGAVSVLRPGLYRVDVGEAGGSSTVTVREGEADVKAGTTAFSVRRESIGRAHRCGRAAAGRPWRRAHQ